MVILGPHITCRQPLGEKMSDVKYEKKGKDLHKQLTFEKTFEQVILRDRLVVVEEVQKVVGQRLDSIIS